jgi:hypothetical protein
MSHPRTDSDKERFAALLIQGETLTAAASAVGISRVTASRWRSDSVVREAITDHRAGVRAHTMHHLGDLTSAALDRVRVILADPDTPSSVIARLLALLLSESRLHNEAIEISERLDLIEARLTPAPEELPNAI